MQLSPPVSGSGVAIPVPAKADVKSISDCSMVSGSAVLNSAALANWSAADEGKIISVAGAGTNTTFNGTTSTSSNPTYITNPTSLVGVSPGQTITGTGIPAGTQIVGIIGATILVISNAATVSGTNTFTVANGLTGTIQSVASPTQIVLSVLAGTNTSTYGNVSCTYGSDDTSNVNAAVAAALAHGPGAKIVLPAGSFYCGGFGSTPLVGISIVGSGPGSTGFGSCAIGTPGLASDMVTLGKWGSVRDCGIEGGSRGIVVTDAYARVSNVEVAGTGSDGIALTTSSSVGGIYRDVHINNVSGNGINVSNSLAYDNDWIGIVVGQSGLNGVALSASDQAFTNLHTWGNGVLGTGNQQNGLRLVGGVAGCRFSNCFFESNFGRGISATTSGCKGHNFNNCWVWHNIGNGIYMFSATYTSIVGCDVYDNGATTNAGAAGIVNDTGSNWIVQGCHMYDDQSTKTQTYAYQELTSSANNVIQGNNMQAANHKTGSSVIVSSTNVPVSASMSTLNQV